MVDAIKSITSVKDGIFKVEIIINIERNIMNFIFKCKIIFNLIKRIFIQKNQLNKQLKNY